MKKILQAIIIGVIACAPSGALADQSQDQLIQSLQAQLQALTARLQALQQDTGNHTTAEEALSFNKEDTNIIGFGQDMFYKGDNDPDDVVTLQNFLTEQGYYSGPITGYYGKATVSAVKRFQKSRGLPQDGRFSGETRFAANAILSGPIKTLSNNTSAPYLKLLTFNGGEKMQFGGAYPIAWDYFGAGSVAIYLQFADGRLCLLENIPASARSYTFIPIENMACSGSQKQVTAGKYKIYLYSLNRTYELTALSKDYFDLVPDDTLNTPSATRAPQDLSAQKPDLTILNFFANPVSVPVNEKTRISFIIINKGSGTVYNFNQYRFTKQADGYLYYVGAGGGSTCDGRVSLAGWESCQVVTDMTFPTSGIKTLQVTLDQDNIIPESDETNNKANITVLALPAKISVGVSRDPVSPASANVSQGQKNVVFSWIRIDAINGDISINKVMLGSDSANAASNFSNIKVYNATHYLGTIQSLNNTDSITGLGWANVQFAPVTISAGQSEIFVIVADVLASASGDMRIGIANLLSPASNIAVSGLPAYGYAMTVVPQVINQSLSIIAPNGGETWDVGTENLIYWNSTNMQSTRVFLYILEKDSAGYWTTANKPVNAIGSSPANYFSYFFSLSPAHVGERKIRISTKPNEVSGVCLDPYASKNADGDCPLSANALYLYDDSDAPFTVTAPTSLQNTTNNTANMLGSISASLDAIAKNIQSIKK